MSSEAPSDQSCVRDGVGYDEMYSSGQDDPAPPMMNEICHPTHLLCRGMRMWMWTG